MFVEEIKISGGGSKHELKLHPEGHVFPDQTYEKKHYHDGKGAHITYETGSPRSTNKYSGDDFRC